MAMLLLMSDTVPGRPGFRVFRTCLYPINQTINQSKTTHDHAHTRAHAHTLSLIALTLERVSKDFTMREAQVETKIP